MLGFSALVYAIVALIIGEHNRPELILLIIYIVLEGLTKLIILLVLLVVALSPLILCLGVCCLCCYNWGNGEAKLPKA